MKKIIVMFLSVFLLSFFVGNLAFATFSNNYGNNCSDLNESNPNAINYTYCELIDYIKKEKEWVFVWTDGTLYECEDEEYAKFLSLLVYNRISKGTFARGINWTNIKLES